MSAAANAAGYLYIHSVLPLPEPRARTETASSAGQPGIPAALVKPARTPAIVYRKRRVYDLPTAA